MKQYVFEAEAFEDYCNWAIYDIKTFRKIKELLRDIKETHLKESESRKFLSTNYQVIGRAGLLTNIGWFTKFPEMTFL